MISYKKSAGISFSQKKAILYVKLDSKKKATKIYLILQLWMQLRISGNAYVHLYTYIHYNRPLSFMHEFWV